MGHGLNSSWTIRKLRGQNLIDREVVPPLWLATKSPLVGGHRCIDEKDELTVKVVLSKYTHLSLQNTLW